MFKRFRCFFDKYIGVLLLVMGLLLVLFFVPVWIWLAVLGLALMVVGILVCFFT